MTLPVTLGTRPTAEERLAASGRGGESSGNELGVTVSEVTPQIARQLGMRQARGVIIREIDPSRLAGQAGLQPNDVILTIDNTEIHSVEDYEQAMADADLAEGVRLRIARRGMVTFYVLRRG